MSLGAETAPYGNIGPLRVETGQRRHLAAAPSVISLTYDWTYGTGGRSLQPQGCTPYWVAHMERFIHRENVRHYQRLLEMTVDESERQRILRLLSEEETKETAAIAKQANKAVGFE